MQENINMLLKNQLKKEDSYSFKCNKCGKCCTNHTGIILTPYDIYNIGRKLGMSVENVIDIYCIQYIGESSRLPIVALERGKCPFVNENGCCLEESRPVICKMYPLGCGYDGTKITYFSVNAKCGEKNPLQTVDDWLMKNGITDEVDVFREKWYGIIGKLGKYVHSREFSKREQDAFQRAVYVMLYLCYDESKPFYSQFSERVECLEQLMQNI